MDIKAVIIDDEPNNIENIQGILNKWCQGIKVMGTAKNADEGIKVITQVKPDLVFLDIQMPEKSGFDLLRAFTTIDFEVIFITAYDQYGIQAIKFSALDYLLKPVDISELQQAIEKVKLKLTNREQNQSIANLLKYIRNTQKEYPRIALPTMQQTHYVKVDEIIRCVASNNYTTFFVNDGAEILVCKTMKEFEELLKPYDFYRTHQSHLVNIQCVKSFLKEDGGMLLMQDMSKVPISRQNLDIVKQALHKMI